MSESAQDPIRVLLFAGGGFGTSMQLGVAHALLVSRGKAPDLVVGVSAGAINAAALAEILQAGSAAADEERRLLAQTARFREVFSICQRAPGELFSALKPNSFQIDTQRPLEPLELPIHSQKERTWRADALASSSGLMAVVNRFLDLRLPIGTVVRGVRRVLGLRAAAEIPREIRPLVVLAELLHLLLLLAPNLARLAPLVRHFLSLPLSAPPRGGSAGELIFRSRALGSLSRALGDAAVTALLIPVWLLAALGVALLGPPLVAVWTLLACLLPWLGVVVGGAWRWARGRSDPAAVRTTSRRIVRLLAGSLDFKVLAVWLRLMLWIAAWSAFGLAVGGALWGAAKLGGVGAGAMVLARDLLLVGLLALVALAFALVMLSRDSLAQRFFARYRLARSLFHYHPLRQIFVELFDRDYFATVGKAGGMDDVVARALDPAHPWPKAAREAGSQPKTIGYYRTVQPEIRIGIVAADLTSNESEVLDESVPVVDALLAATAVSPIFPPQELEIRGEKRLLIDGVNIANEPTRPALKYLREHADELRPGAPAVHLYPVSTLPVSLSELSDTAAARADDRSLLEIVRRALELQRFRDATLERRLTELYSRTIPSGHPGFVYQTADKKYLRTWVYPIEPERPVTVNGDLLGATSDDERRRIVGEAVADGCRAAMERMIRDDIAAAAGTGTTTACRTAVARRLGRDDPDAAGLPGSAGSGGPGVCEVCRYCALQRGGVDEKSFSLRVVARAVAGSEPIWPLRNGAPAAAPATYPERADDGHKQEVEAALRAYRASGTFEGSPWPRPRDGREGNERATVSLLFGGGVFRGVYQVGVVNALSEVGL
ncbi:MAG TPA: patatin-like phospholipase family protein, partial [Thermoanaerobaculia bacterium]